MWSTSRRAELSLRIVQILLKSANNKIQCNLKLFYWRIPENGFEYKKELKYEYLLLCNA
jgi:hypothetical protein